MSLLALIRKGGLAKAATATTATLATHARQGGGTVATVATVAVANPPKEEGDALPDPAAEARRQRVLAMLTERPGIRGAMQDGWTVTCELRIPREKWDGVLFLEMLERHTVH